MPTTRRVKRRKATRGGSRSVQKARIESAGRAAAGRNLGNWAKAATAATTGERHRRRLAERARLWGNNRNPKLHHLTNRHISYFLLILDILTIGMNCCLQILFHCLLPCSHTMD